MIEFIFKDNNVALKLDELKNRTDKATKDGIRQAQIHVQGKITSNLASGKFNIKSRTGNLAGSMALSPVYNIGGSLAGIVGSNLKYARIQEVGGMIFPVKKNVLSFKIGDKWVFAKSVRIPAHFYMASTLDEEKDNIVSIISNKQKEALDVKA